MELTYFEGHAPRLRPWCYGSTTYKTLKFIGKQHDHTDIQI